MAGDDTQISCEEHGSATCTYVCSHLIQNPVQRWHADYPTADNRWPDAWCDRCNVAFLREGEWNESNETATDIKLLCHQCYERALARSVDRLSGARAEAWQELLRKCHDELVAKQDVLTRDYQLSRHKRWDWDQERAEIVFSNDGVPAVLASVEFAGSVSTKSNTWLWSWANANVLESVRSRIVAVRDLGEREEYPHLTVPKWNAEEADGWDMAAVAAHVLNAAGVYRTPGDTGFTFMLLSDVRLAQ
jgi:hypothetical protein